MILKFTTNWKEQEDFVSVNGSRPMAQASMGCRSMFDFADAVGGVSFSDQYIPTWGPAKFSWNKYWYAHIDKFGSVGHGFVDGRVSDALGFKIADKERLCDGWWSADNNLHLLNPDQTAQWRHLRYSNSKKEADAYIVGLFPPMTPVVETPVQPKKGMAKRAVVLVPKV